MANYQDPNVRNANAWLTLGGQAADAVAYPARWISENVPTPAENMRGLVKGMRRDYYGGQLPEEMPKPKPAPTLAAGHVPHSPFVDPKLMGPPSVLPMSQIPLAIGNSHEDNAATVGMYDWLQNLTPEQLQALQGAAGGGGAPGGGAGGGGGGGLGGGFGAAGKGELHDILAQLKAKGDQMAEAQRNAAAPLRDALGNTLKDPLQYDLGPLAALVDQWSGSNFAQTYKAPESVQERQGKILGLQQGIAGTEAKAQASEMQALKDYAAGKMDLRKMESDEAYKRAMLGIQQQELGLKREALDIDRMKAAQKLALSPMEAFNLRSKISDSADGKVYKGLTDMRVALNNYEAAVKKHGLTPTGKGSAELQEKFQDVVMTAKKAYELGALAGPDMDLIAQGIRNAGSPMAWATQTFSGGSDSILAQIRGLKQRSDAAAKRTMANLEATAGPALAPYVGGVLGTLSEQYSNAQGGNAALANAARAELARRRGH